MSSENNNSYQNLPDVPWWLIIVGFATFTPVGIALLLYKIFRESKPNPQRWNQQQSTIRQDTSYNVRQDTNYDVRRSADGSKQVTIEQSRRPAPAQQRTQVKSHSQRSGGSYTPQRRFPLCQAEERQGLYHLGRCSGPGLWHRRGLHHH